MCASLPRVRRSHGVDCVLWCGLPIAESVLGTLLALGGCCNPVYPLGKIFVLEFDLYVDEKWVMIRVLPERHIRLNVEDAVLVWGAA